MRRTVQITFFVFFFLFSCGDARKWDKYNQAIFKKMNKENVVKIDYKHRQIKNNSEIVLARIDDIKKLFKKSNKIAFHDLYSTSFNIVITMKNNDRIEMTFFDQNVVRINGVYYDIPDDINVAKWSENLLDAK